jgi:hypothetical protein
MSSREALRRSQVSFDDGSDRLAIVLDVIEGTDQDLVCLAHRAAAAIFAISTPSQD